MFLARISWLGLIVGLLLSWTVLVHSKESVMPQRTSYRTVKVPRLLVLWGKHDPSFDPGEPQRFLKDVPKVEVHVLDAGHFALDTRADEIAALIGAYPGKSQDVG
jgi:hypothetical protein